MLIKHLLPRCSIFLGKHGKNAVLLWHYTVKRHAGTGSVSSGESDDEPPGADLSYTNQSTWHRELFTCRAEQTDQHSPINIVTTLTKTKTFDPFFLVNYDKPHLKLVLSNNGNLVKIKFDKMVPGFTGGGHSDHFLADHLHFHWGMTSEDGSEHYKNDASFPMEMHIVHYNAIFPTLDDADGQYSGVSVLAFLFEISEDQNEAFDPIVNSLKKIYFPYQTTFIHMPSIGSLLPQNLDNFYQYNNEAVLGFPTITWTVFNDMIKISEAQLNKFRSLQSTRRHPVTQKAILLGNNFRDPEEIPGLQVFSSFDTPHSEPIKKGNAFARLIYRLVCGGKKKKRTPV